MLSKEELAMSYWQNQQRANRIEREQKKAASDYQQELSKPEYTIGLINSEGQLEIIQAKPVSKTVKLLPEVLGFVVSFLITFALIENYIGV